MIVTEGGKNVYPEDIETVFGDLPVKEYCVFAANYLWLAKSGPAKPGSANALGKEVLVLVIRLEQNQEFSSALKEQITASNRRLPDFKRVGGYTIWEKEFPRTASMKIKRNVLAEELGKALDPSAVVAL
jgi:long-chain acyl-CoA synthetase